MTLKKWAIAALIASFCSNTAMANTTIIDESSKRPEGPRDLTNFKIRPANWNDASGKALDFMAGSWIGSNDSMTVEEIWTPLQGNDWFGVVKMKKGEDVQFKIFSFQYTAGGRHGGLFGTMRVLDKNFEKVSEYCALKQMDNHELGTAIFEFNDGSKYSYKIADQSTLNAVVNGKEIVLKKR
jgi:hypothetical protein